MKFARLVATPDIVGRRIYVRWEYVLDGLETPGSLPPVQLRRKERDFAFPPPLPNDPYTVYQSSAFPPPPVPGTLLVTDLPAWEIFEDGLRVQASAISLARYVAGIPQEFLRRIVYTTYDASDAPIRVRIELLDASSLDPGTLYYYQLDDGVSHPEDELDRYRASAVAGGTHALNRRLYEMLPQIYKKHDVRMLPAANELPGVPESTPSGGQLRRFVDMFGMGLDAMRSSAEALLQLHDGYEADHRFLPSLSRMVGWEPTARLGIPQRRNELLTANRLFKVVGTVPALRALVTLQTGWHSQIAEFAQHVVRANQPARRNIYGAEDRQPDPWRGVDDAAPLFGFPEFGANGSGTAPAVLTSTLVEPFALRAGMELTITVDDGVPARVRFGPAGFADVGAATAAEIAAAISNVFDNLVAQGAGGAVELRTHSVGPEAAVRVEGAATSLLALNDAPAGPLSAFADVDGHIRLFYEQKQDPRYSELATFPATITGLKEEKPRRTLRFKSWGYGEWRDEVEVPGWAGDATSPFAVELEDISVFACWIDQAQPEESRLRYAIGEPRIATAAVLTSTRREPFTLQVGTQLTLRGRFGTEQYTVLAADFANPAGATTAEVAAAMNAQLAQVTATALADGALRLVTNATGDPEFLEVDLAQSTAARSLGLASRRLIGRGRWDAEIDWAGPESVPLLWAPVADPSVVRDPLGGARVFWAEHHNRIWQIRQMHWSDRLTVVTAAGAAQRSAGAWQAWKMADGLPSNDVRAVAVDANGSLWFATAAGLASRRPDNVWTVLTTVNGLASNDVRDLAFLPDGRLWCATPSGVSELLPNGTFNTLTAATTGLAGDDVRAVVADGRGNAWAATTAGVSRRSAASAWSTWTAADGISAGTPRDIAVGAQERVALATSTGLSLRAGDAWITYTTVDGLASNDVSAAAFGRGDTLYAGTTAGLSIWNGRKWRQHSTADGLPSNDVRAIAIASDGTLVLGTSAGVVTGTETSWTAEGTAVGLPADLVVGVHTTWSAPVALATAGGSNREPRAAVDAAGVTWLVWSRRTEIVAGSSDTWTLRLRRFDPAVSPWAWLPEQPVTTAPINPVEDREPWLEPQQAGGYRVFFSSDRGGGRGIWWVPLDNAGNPGALGSLPADAAETTAPTAVTGPTGNTWLFYRSDQSISPSQVGVLPPITGIIRPSARVADAGSLRLQAGCRTPVLAHAARNLGRRTWGDLFTYSPEYPEYISEEAPSNDHLYTRRTIGLYLRQSRNGQPFTLEQIQRLAQLLRRLLPINLRVVLIVAPEPLIEYLYSESADITDSYFDDVTLVEVVNGPSDSTSVNAPDWAVLLSNDLLSLSYSASDLNTLRRRTWFPDLL